jgi:Holliday junction DNA helicase RuvB
MIESGPNARTVQISKSVDDWHTTRLVCFAPYEARFEIASRLQSCNRITDLYSRLASASIFNAVSMEAAIEIFGRSRGNTSYSNALLRRVRDFAQIKEGTIDIEVARCYMKKA